MTIDECIIADLEEAGGGTYESGTFLPFRPANGFAVGVGGCKLPLAALPDLHPARLLRMVSTEFETSFVGTWLDSGTVHIDAVEFFGADRRIDAILRAQALGQQAIYDFDAQEVITL